LSYTRGGAMILRREPGEQQRVVQMFADYPQEIARRLKELRALTYHLDKKKR
jgi:hypothetical protein